MVRISNIKYDGEIISFDGIGDGVEKFYMKFNILTGEDLESTTENMMYLSEAKFKILSYLADHDEFPNELVAMSF